jgi:TetR/AcrR family transcriptional repressor of nem operon
MTSRNYEDKRLYGLFSFFDSEDLRPMRLFWSIFVYVNGSVEAAAMTKGEMTRNRIVAQAAPIFNTRGFAGCSMQDVLEATGLQKGGLYRHFSSKEELAAAAFGYATTQAQRLRTEKLDKTHGAVEQLRSIVQRFVESPSATPGGCPLMNTAIDADDGNPTLRKLARDAFSNWRERISAVVREGQKNGEIKRNAEPRRIANTLIAALEGALMLSRLEQSALPLQDARASLEQILAKISTS